MKQLICLVLLAVPCLINAQSSSGVQWAENLTWDQVKQKAKQENKYIFIDAYATWCGPCKMMDKKVYPDKALGDFVNDKFISVKVQMDQTDKDDQATKAWYKVGQSFNQQYGIDGYPSFLFFSPEGKFVYKQLGMKTPDEFIAITKEALSDPEARYQRKIEKFKTGHLEYSQMPELAREARHRKDKEMSIAIAKSYKEGYIDNLGEDEAFSQANLSFIADFSYDILKSDDKYFLFFRNQPGQADSLINRRNQGKIQKISSNVIAGVIRKEEIVDKIYKDKKPLTVPSRSWKQIKSSIEKKYGKVYVDRFFPNEQIDFYEAADDWGNYAKYVNEKIKKTPPQKNGNAFGPMFSDAWQLNWYAWTVFENCTDNKILKKALEWVNLSLELQEMPYSVDTKANLLYKMGRIKDAIAVEEKAVSIAQYEKTEMSKTLDKMKAGLPTWPQK